MVGGTFSSNPSSTITANSARSKSARRKSNLCVADSITSETVGDSTLRRLRVSVAVADMEDEDKTEEAAAAEAEAKADEEEAADDDEDADEDASADETCTGADEADKVEEDCCGDMADWSARSCGPASFSLKASSRHAPAASLRLALSIRFLRHSASK